MSQADRAAEAAPPRSARGRRLAAAALVALLAAAAAAYAATQWPAWRAAHAYRVALAAPSDEAKVEGLRRALALDPRHHEARRALAQLQLARGDVEAAFLEFETLVELFPDDAAAWLGLARTWLAADMAASAETAATRAIELARAAPVADSFALRARIRERLGRRYGAALDARQVLRLVPGDAEAAALAQRVESAPPPDAPPAPAIGGERFWPGRLAAAVQGVVQRLQRQDFAAARELADDVARRYPQTMAAPWLAGIVAYSHGQFVDAERQLRIALARAPRSSRAATNLAGAWAKQHGPEYAAGKLLELQHDDPGFLVPLDIAATAYLELRQPAQAERALRRGLELAAPPPQAFLQLAHYYRELDRAAEAQRACEDGLARWPGQLELSLCRAEAQALAGDAAGAAASYEALLAARPDALAPRVALLRLLAGRDDADARARTAELARSLRLDAPTDADALDAVGWAQLRLGDARAGAAWLAAAARAGADDPGMHYHYGAALAAIGDRGGARRELGAALTGSAPFAERPDAQRLLRELEGSAGRPAH